MPGDLVQYKQPPKTTDYYLVTGTWLRNDAVIIKLMTRMAIYSSASRDMSEMDLVTDIFREPDDV